MLRATADPRKAYEDGRVDAVLEVIRNVAVNLKNQESENWKRLNKFTQDIFIAEEEEIVERYKEWQEND